MAPEVRVMGCEGFELPIKPEVILLLPLLQHQLLVYHHLSPLSQGSCLRVEIVLQLVGGVDMGLSLGIQLLGTLHQLPGLGIELTDSNLLFRK
jgi:hypothetical protein